MSTNQDFSDINTWRNSLGLLPVRLFNDHQQEHSYVLLNGNRGNFCLDFQKNDFNIDSREYAWSANVGHYVYIDGENIIVQRWDKQRASIERYTRSSVYGNLEKFHEYLEKDSPSEEISIIAHSIGVFRRLRATLGKKIDGSKSLNVFLYLLGSIADHAGKGDLDIANWKIDPETLEIVNSIRMGDWAELEKQFSEGRSVDQLTPNLPLLLRHASGQLFQEANYEALFIPQHQYSLDGFLPSPVKISRESTGVGVHFTPAALSRTLVEEALSYIDINQESIFIFDPACGSGEFLRETMRQLNIQGYKGKINILGWDISKTACNMARFVLAWEEKNSENTVKIEIKEIDSLDPEINWPSNVDVVFMNPPFVAWQDLSNNQQTGLKKILGEFGMQRSNLAYAFLLKAAENLRSNGVVGTILPASLLNATSAYKLREHLSNQLSPKLIARLGSHNIFSNALIDPALYVAKKESNSIDPSIALWADHKPKSYSTGLRTLRKLRFLNSKANLPVNKDGFSIYYDMSIGRSGEDWSPRQFTSWVTLNKLDYFPRVKDLFDIHQGVRSGANDVYLVDFNAWKNIPPDESIYFRPAVINKSIKFGFLKDLAYIFYPHGDLNFINELDLSQKAPYFYRNFLIPNKERLLSRPRVNLEKWWELSEHRAWQTKTESKIVTTYFGNAGSFAWDESGYYVVVQGFSWLSKFPARSAGHNRKVSLAYLAILNSRVFSELLSAVSNNLSGGQWDLSKRYLDNLPLPDLFNDGENALLTQKLSDFGEKIYQGYSIDENAQDILVKKVYFLE
jgi:hypothetical protein